MPLSRAAHLHRLRGWFNQSGNGMLQPLHKMLLALAACLLATAAMAQDTPPAPAAAPAVSPQIGTLVVDIAAFNSERDLPKKVVKQLESGAIEWGVKDNQVVFTMVNRRFIDFPVSHMTRYGQSETLLLPAGEYKITGLGLELTAGFNVQKILDRGAYVNEDVLHFTIEPGKTTTLKIDPKIYKDAAFIVDFWMPTLMTSVVTDAGSSPAVSLCSRLPTSIAWPQYKGPLKFKTAVK